MEAVSGTWVGAPKRRSLKDCGRRTGGIGRIAIEPVDLADIDVFVLAGGLGTRLRSAIGYRPKIMAEVGKRPFVDIFLEDLAQRGVRKVTLGLGYQAAQVVEYLRTRSWAGLSIRTVVEPQPLGTAGAVSHGRRFLTSDPVLVMNGDTIVRTDLNSFLASHLASGADVSVVCARTSDSGRYGTVEIDERNLVLSFREKAAAIGPGAAWVSAGTYLFSGAILDNIAAVQKGSLERDVLARFPPGFVRAFMTSEGFIDIGTPESLREARTRLGCATPARGR